MCRALLLVIVLSSVILFLPSPTAAWNRKKEEDIISHLPFTVPAPILAGIKGYREFHEEGNYTVFVFNNSIPEAIKYKGLPTTFLHFLAVAGGGAGGDSLPDLSVGGGGGGAGGCVEQSFTVAGKDTVSITVGGGGKGAKRTNGGDTLVQWERDDKHNMRAYGGGAGGLSGKGGAKGGSGGGHGSESGPRKGVIAVSAVQGNPGGSTLCSRGCGGSGGGGAGSAGGPGGNVHFDEEISPDTDAASRAAQEEYRARTWIGDESLKGLYTGHGGDGRVCQLPGIAQLYPETYWGGGGGGANHGKAPLSVHEGNLPPHTTADSQAAGAGGKGGGGGGAVPVGSTGLGDATGIAPGGTGDGVKGGDGGANTGGGGGGGVGTGGTGGDGGSGIVVLSTLTHVCAPGAYAMQSDVTHITICTPCPANTYKTLAGSSALSSCVKCLKGTFAGVGSSACRNCVTGNPDPNCQGRHLNNIKRGESAHEEL